MPSGFEGMQGRGLCLSAPARRTREKLRTGGRRGRPSPSRRARRGASLRAVPAATHRPSSFAPAPALPPPSTPRPSFRAGASLPPEYKILNSGVHLTPKRSTLDSTRGQDPDPGRGRARSGVGRCGDRRGGQARGVRPQGCRGSAPRQDDQGHRSGCRGGASTGDRADDPGASAPVPASA